MLPNASLQRVICCEFWISGYALRFRKCSSSVQRTRLIGFSKFTILNHLKKKTETDHYCWPGSRFQCHVESCWVLSSFKWLGFSTAFSWRVVVEYTYRWLTACLNYGVTVKDCSCRNLFKHLLGLKQTFWVWLLLKVCAGMWSSQVRSHNQEVCHKI